MGLPLFPSTNFASTSTSAPHFAVPDARTAQVPPAPAGARPAAEIARREPASSRYAEALACFEQGRDTEAAAKLPEDPSDPTWTAEEAGLRARSMRR